MTNFNNYGFQSTGDNASAAKIKLEEHIHNKIRSAREVLDMIESQIINDQVIKGSALQFEAVSAEDAFNGRKQLLIHTPSKVLNIHDNALMQLSKKAAVPAIFTRNLMQGEDWRQQLLAHNFNEIYHKGNGTKYLIRDVDGEARGFLSDKFKRMDSRPLMDAFCGSAADLGAIPVEGFALDTKVRMRALLPVVFEPIAGEVFAFGMEWGTSDFGDGGNYLSIFLLRLTCLNGATMADVMRKIHLGSRLSEDIEFSRETYELDTKANAAALKDAVRFALNPARVDAYMDALQRANQQTLSSDQAEKRLKAVLPKDEAERAFDAFKSPDVVNLPKGSTTYRMSNAISWIANFEDVSRARQLELQKIAGDVLPAIKNDAIEELSAPPKLYYQPESRIIKNESHIMDHSHIFA